MKGSHGMSPSFPAVRITRRVFLAGIHVLLIIQPTAGQCQNREWMKYCYHNGLISSGSNIFPKKLEKPKKKFPPILTPLIIIKIPYQKYNRISQPKLCWKQSRAHPRHAWMYSGVLIFGYNYFIIDGVIYGWLLFSVCVEFPPRILEFIQFCLTAT